MDAGSPSQLIALDDVQSVCGRSRPPPKASEMSPSDMGLEEELHWYSIFDPHAPESVFDRHYWVLPFTNPYTEGQYRAFITTRNWTLMIFALGVGIAFLVVVFVYETYREWHGILNVTAGVLLILMSPVIYVFVIRPEQNSGPGAELSSSRMSHGLSKQPRSVEARKIEPLSCAVARSYEKCALIVLLLISAVPVVMYSLKARCFRGRTGINSDYTAWWKTCDLDYAVHSEVRVFFLTPITMCTLRFLCVAPIVLLWLMLGFVGRAIDPVDSPLNAALGALVFIAVAFSTMLASFAVDIASRKRFEQLARLQRTRADLEQRQESVESILAQLLPPEAMSQLHTERILVESSACCSIAIFALEDFHRCSWEYSPLRLLLVLTTIHSIFDSRLRTLSSLSVTKISARGDRYVTSCGLRQVNGLKGDNPLAMPTNPLGSDFQEGMCSRPQQSALTILKFSQWQLRQVERLEAIGLLTPYGIPVDGEEAQPWSTWKPKISIGTGPCAGGVIGFGSLYYEAVGAAPRLAERLLVFAPPSQVTVCQRTSELVREVFAQTPLFLTSIDAPPFPAFIVESCLREGGGLRGQSGSSSSWPVASPSESSPRNNRDKEASQQQADGGSSQASGASVRFPKKVESDRTQYLSNVVSRLRQRQGLEGHNADEGLVQALGDHAEDNGKVEQSLASPRDSTVSITTRLADTETLTAELSDFLVEAPVARFCHLLPFPRESVLDPLYHRWRERSDHIDGTVGTASVFLFYTTVLIALLVDAREQIAGLTLFCISYLIVILRLSAKSFVKRWSAVETVLSLFVVETLGLVSLFLIYYEKKAKPLPPRERLLYPNASPDYYYHTMALGSVMWCRHVDWRIVLVQRVVQVALSVVAIFWQRFYLSVYLATGPFETLFIVVAAFHFQKSARTFFVTELLASSTEDLAKSRYLLQQGILQLLVPSFAMPRVTNALSQRVDDSLKVREASTQPNRSMVSEMLNGLVSTCENSVYLIIRYDEDASVADPRNASSVRPSNEHQLPVAFPGNANEGAETNEVAAVEGLFRAERAFKPLDDALLAVADAAPSTALSIQKVRVGGGQAVVAGPYLEEGVETAQGGAVSHIQQVVALQQLLDLILLMEKSHGREGTEGLCGRFTYVLTVGQALTVVVGLSPPQVDVLGAAPPGKPSPSLTLLRRGS